MSQLIPCTHCARYIRDDESTCPFCSRAISTPAHALPAQRPASGLSRAASFAARAALAAGAATAALACGDEDDDAKAPQATGGQATGGQATGGTDGSIIGDGGDPGLGGLGGDDGFTPVPIYGGPFPDMMRARV